MGRALLRVVVGQVGQNGFCPAQPAVETRQSGRLRLVALHGTAWPGVEGLFRIASARSANPTSHCSAGPAGIVFGFHFLVEVNKKACIFGKLKGAENLLALVLGSLCAIA